MKGGSRTSALSLSAVLVLAGLLFTTSAQTARGTSLRTDRSDAAALLRAERERYAGREHRVMALGGDIQNLTAAEAKVNGTVAALRSKIAPLAVAAGFDPVTGPTIEVRLDDAPRDGARTQGARPDDLVVHQQDVQAVVNALWTGGAEAMTIMDQRVIATSAVRCVGNTLFLQNKVYSPPYRIAAIGDPTALLAALARSSDLQTYQQYVRRFQLGWQVIGPRTTTMPGYAGSTALRFATTADSR